MVNFLPRFILLAEKSLPTDTDIIIANEIKCSNLLTKIHVVMYRNDIIRGEEQMKNLQKLSAFLLALMLTFSLVACGQAQNSQTNGEKTEPSADSVETLNAQINQLMLDENKIFDSHKDLWDKVFLKMDKQSAPAADPEKFSYVDDVLLKTINTNIKEFAEEEVKTLMADVEKIRELESKISELSKKVAAMGNGSTPAVSTESGNTVFPAFEGKDFDGNSVDSSLFSKNAVTVVNYWFNGCTPCVNELPELNALNEELKAKGGAVIGINSEALIGGDAVISEAKEILAKQGASYANIYFDPSSAAGKMTLSIVSFPTTIVVDRNGNIIGEPLLGAISNEQVAKELHARIDSVLANDKK